MNPNPFAHAVSRVLWHGAAIKKGQKSDVLDPVAWSSGKKAGYLGVIQGYDTSCVLQQNFLKRVSSEIAMVKFPCLAIKFISTISSRSTFYTIFAI